MTFLHGCVRELNIGIKAQHSIQATKLFPLPERICGLGEGKRSKGTSRTWLCRHRTGIVGIKFFYFILTAKGFFLKALWGGNRLSLRFYNNFWIWCLYASCLLYCPNVPCLLLLLSVSTPPHHQRTMKDASLHMLQVLTRCHRNLQGSQCHWPIL